MATCPVIKYGVPDAGAPEYNVNSGRELFRCADCVKLYVTNVSLEKSVVKYSCGAVMDAIVADGKACLQSANASARDRDIINWIAKNDVDSSLPNGYVITRVGECAGGSGITYTHTEGNISVRAYANIEDVSPEFAESLINTAKEKLAQYNEKINNLDYYLSDLNTNVSPTDWQSMSATFSGVGSEPIYNPEGNVGGGLFRVSFNWNNGRAEVSEGKSYYDDTAEPDLLSNIISYLISE